MKLLVALVFPACLFAQPPAPLEVVNVYGLTSSTQVQDNRSSNFRSCNYHGFEVITGTGSWSVQMEYSDTSASGPWTLFSSSAIVAYNSAPPVGSAFGYHNWIRFNTTAGATQVNYSCSQNYFINPNTGGGGGGGTPGGSPGQIQTNVSGTSFGGFTASGDATINTGTGVVTVQGIQSTPVPTPATGYLYYTGSAFIFQTPSGGGNVSTSGSPAQFQLAAFVNGTAITGLPVGTSGYPLVSNGSSNASFQKLSLATGVTGNLPVANLNSGTGATSTTFWRGDGTWATPASGGSTSCGGVSGYIQLGNGSGGFTCLPGFNLVGTSGTGTAVQSLGVAGTQTGYLSLYNSSNSNFYSIWGVAPTSTTVFLKLPTNIPSGTQALLGSISGTALTTSWGNPTPGGPAGGDLAGFYASPSVIAINGALFTGVLGDLVSFATTTTPGDSGIAIANVVTLNAATNAFTGNMTIGGTLGVTGALTLSNLASAGTQCVQVSSVGLVTGTGSACGSGSGGANAAGYYLVTQAANAPSNAVNVGLLTTGLLKITVASSIATPSTASPGTGSANDYIPPQTGTANYVFATPNGSSGYAVLRALVSGDIPSALPTVTSVNGTTIPTSVTLLTSPLTYTSPGASSVAVTSTHQFTATGNNVINFGAYCDGTWSGGTYSGHDDNAALQAAFNALGANGISTLTFPQAGLASGPTGSGTTTGVCLSSTTLKIGNAFVKSYANGAMSSSSAVLTDTTNSPFTPGNVGNSVQVLGTNIGGSGINSIAGTITGYTSSSQVTLSVSATNSVSSATYYFGLESTQNGFKITGQGGRQHYYPGAGNISPGPGTSVIAYTGSSLGTTPFITVAGPIHAIEISGIAADCNHECQTDWYFPQISWSNIHDISAMNVVSGSNKWNAGIWISAYRSEFSGAEFGTQHNTFKDLQEIHSATYSSITGIMIGCQTVSISACNGPGADAGLDVSGFNRFSDLTIDAPGDTSTGVAWGYMDSNFFEGGSIGAFNPFYLIYTSGINFPGGNLWNGMGLGGATAYMTTSVFGGSHAQQITSSINASTCTIPTNFTSNIPTTSLIQIDNEVIAVIAQSGGSVTSCARGFGGSVATTHSSAAVIVGPTGFAIDGSSTTPLYTWGNNLFTNVATNFGCPFGGGGCPASYLSQLSSRVYGVAGNTSGGFKFNSQSSTTQATPLGNELFGVQVNYSVATAVGTTFSTVGLSDTIPTFLLTQPGTVIHLVGKMVAINNAGTTIDLVTGFQLTDTASTNITIPSTGSFIMSSGATGTITFDVYLTVTQQPGTATYAYIPSGTMTYDDGTNTGTQTSADTRNFGANGPTGRSITSGITIAPGGYFSSGTGSSTLQLQSLIIFIHVPGGSSYIE